MEKVFHSEKIENESLTPSQDGDQLSMNACDDSEGIMKKAFKPENIFPDKVWTKILEYSTNSVKENLINLSPYFRDLLLNERTTILFPKVWNVLAVNLHQNGLPLSQSEQTENNNFSQRDPSADILKCRLVSRKWCDAIDKFYEDLPKVLLEDKTIMKSPNCLLNRFVNGPEYDIHTWPLRHIVHHFWKTHLARNVGTPNRNPILGRRLNIIFGELNENFLEHVQMPLEKIGQHIWYSKITVEPDIPSWTAWYKMLRQVLQLLPNLKALSIDYTIFNEDQPDDEKIEGCDLDQLKREIKSNPLPKLKSLQSLKTSRVIAPIFKEIIRNNWLITSLKADQANLPNEDCDLFSSLLPKLKILQVICRSQGVFESLESAMFNHGLDKLTLDFKPLPGLNWKHVFKFVRNKWGPRLTNLDLKLPKNPDTSKGIVILEESASRGLYLRLLKHLKIDIPRLACLDFILPMKDTLETLEVTTEHFVLNRYSKFDSLVKHKQQKVQFVGWTDDLNASNIWIMFPKLEKVTHREPYKEHVKTWTRKEWEQELDSLSMTGVASACGLNKSHECFEYSIAI